MDSKLLISDFVIDLKTLLKSYPMKYVLISHLILNIVSRGDSYYVLNFYIDLPIMRKRTSLTV